MWLHSSLPRMFFFSPGRLLELLIGLSSLWAYEIIANLYSLLAAADDSGPPLMFMRTCHPTLVFLKSHGTRQVCKDCHSLIVLENCISRLFLLGISNTTGECLGTPQVSSSVRDGKESEIPHCSFFSSFHLSWIPLSLLLSHARALWEWQQVVVLGVESQGGDPNLL